MNNRPHRTAGRIGAVEHSGSDLLGRAVAVVADADIVSTAGMSIRQAAATLGVSRSVLPRARGANTLVRQTHS